MNKIVAVGMIMTLFAASVGTFQINTNNAEAQEQPTTVAKVAAGGGNATAPWTIFVPQNVEINAGESVTWYNPTEGAAEPHTVTFILDNNTMAGVVSPLLVANTTKFTSLPPGSNNEPVLLPDTTGGGMNTLLAVNARTFEPAIIDAQGNVTFMKPNANYSMTGTEKYINSGWFLPNGLEGEYPGSGNTFTVKFEKQGTYDYLCILHPWMTGSVIVK
ncbi:MAG TPA: plastocyanin/azurin family copper-binding protein [Nitrososphaeraceae archaeon]|nr:plastocyanin/azurin family copper-binding protein [Nitrososphaeraceae archaeon]